MNEPRARPIEYVGRTPQRTCACVQKCKRQRVRPTVGTSVAAVRRYRACTRPEKKARAASASTEMARRGGSNEIALLRQAETEAQALVAQAREGTSRPPCGPCVGAPLRPYRDPPHPLPRRRAQAEAAAGAGGGQEGDRGVSRAARGEATQRAAGGARRCVNGRRGAGSAAERSARRRTERGSSSTRGTTSAPSLVWGAQAQALEAKVHRVAQETSAAIAQLE
jgi:hypothetical protein